MIQNAVSWLPSAPSYATYYWLQRRFGGLRKFNPIKRLDAGVDAWRRLLAAGHNPIDNKFFEVGTGRVPLVPMAFWLMGASKTVTIDLNPYVKHELVRESLDYMAGHRDEIEQVFGENLFADRLSQLLAIRNAKSYDLAGVLKLCQIEYVAPGDAAHTSLADGSMDVHASYTVFEHIPPSILTDILTEGNRLVGPAGWFVHRIDYSDHFSHSDNSISRINFLQYSDEQWSRFADNRYMYMNRLRHDDFLAILEEAGHQIRAVDPVVDPELSKIVQSGQISLDARFRGKSDEVISTTGAWVVSQLRDG